MDIFFEKVAKLITKPPLHVLFKNNSKILVIILSSSTFFKNIYLNTGDIINYESEV